ncbi:MAG: membrane protein FxsA [Mycobacterium kyogaense]|uniref:FxsA family protein n=1 Tax=Mycobacterium kyogaense TaxID=2212479 RepID=UPI002FFC738F
MAMRLFALYVVVEMAVLIALTATIGFGWTMLAVTATFLLGLALAGSQLRRHLRRLQTGLTADNAAGVVTDSALVALGTVLVVIPGIASTVVGALLLLPPTRAIARPVVTAMAARRAPLIVGAGTASGFGAQRFAYRPARGDYTGGDYIDGEVIDIVDGPVDAPVDASPEPRTEPRRLPE